MLSQQLQVFLQVAECGSFSKAAQRLFVTPASIMKHINTLENRLGVTLLVRSRQGTELTAAGRALYEGGKKLAASADKLAGEVKTAAHPEGIPIRVGSSLLNPGRVLTDLWAPLREKYPEYKFRLVPYEDTKEQILTVIASLGEQIDVLAGSFNAKSMHKMARYLVLGSSRLCIAVPEGHPLASREDLTLEDLYGEQLVMVKSGDTLLLDQFENMLKSEHPRIQVKETDYYYDIDTFNTCGQEGSLLLTLDSWADIHPAFATIPLRENYRIPFGVLYSPAPSREVQAFIEILRTNIQEPGN